jgi:ATP-dependent Clp protease ATP-binding subunit ClpA
MNNEKSVSPTPRYSRILDASVGIARSMGHDHVGVEHLFLAIINDPDAIPTRQLADITDVDALKARLRALMSSASYDTIAPIPE